MTPVSPTGADHAVEQAWLDRYLDAMALSSAAQPEIPANAIPVSNCDDDGAGSLRAAVASAVSGDTIDMTQLTCGTITLTDPIGISIDDLTIVGHRAKYATLTASGTQGVLFHAGLGTLKLENMIISGGEKYFADALARGGCVFSAGSVTLDGVEITQCEAHNNSMTERARGGGVYAANTVSMINSSVSGCMADTPHGYADGGGVFATNLVLNESALLFDQAYARGGGAMVEDTLGMVYSLVAYDQSRKGGGLISYGNVVMLNSTLYRNQAYFSGGLYAGNHSATIPFKIISSTISGNAGEQPGGGVAFAYNDAQVYNSTIAYNTEGTNYLAGAGIELYNSALTLQSSIVARNYNVNPAVAGHDDIGFITIGSVSGAANLVMSSAVPLPADTLTVDPMFDGMNEQGIVPTIALSASSPAIDHGANPLNIVNDQRGTGFPRVWFNGPDIGAFELNDRIFANGFD